MKFTLHTVAGSRLIHLARRMKRKLLGGGQFDEVEHVYSKLIDYFENSMMIDVGAHHGRTLFPFLLKGWDVLAFEPDEMNLSVLKKRIDTFRKAERERLTVMPMAVTLKDGEKLDFYRSAESTGISGLIPFRSSHAVGQVVETITLKTALAQVGCKSPGLLKVDTEGFDLFVLQSYPWDEQDGPEVIICEFEDEKTCHVGYSFHELGHFLIEKGYRVLMSEWEPIVRYGIQHTWRTLKEYPCELEASRGWGNFIAVKNASLVDILLESRKIK